MRRLIVIASLVLLAVPLAAAGPQDEWWREGGARIRPLDTRTSSLLADGLLRSATLRALARRIEANDVFVYVGMQPFLRHDLSGALSWVTSAGGFRYLRVGLNPNDGKDQTIATLAHEMQHVVEIIDEARVVDEASLVDLYRRIGDPSRVHTRSWDTTAAQSAGQQARRELAAAPAMTLARGNDATPATKGS